MFELRVQGATESQDSCLADDSRSGLTDASERCIVEGISEDLGRRLGIQASRRLGWGELARPGRVPSLSSEHQLATNVVRLETRLPATHSSIGVVGGRTIVR